MRLVFLSDTHGVKLQRPVPDGDVLIHCGDFTQLGRENELSVFADWFSSFPHKQKLFLSGNHDLMFERDPVRARLLVPGGEYLLDTAFEIEGVKFYGSPWTPEFYSWAFMKERGSELKAVWDKIPENTDVLLTHGPPHGVLDYVPHSKLNVGCEELARAVERVKPALHVFGHIHEAYGQKLKSWDAKQSTLFINASNCNVSHAGLNPPVAVDLVRDARSRKISVSLV